MCVTARYVTDKYKLEMNNAQNSQLSKAIASGVTKGVFVLPKGTSADAGMLSQVANH